MNLEDERLEEIRELEKKLKISEDSREVLEAHTRLQDNRIRDMEEKVDADFQVILTIKTKLDKVKEYINNENFHSDDSDNLKNLLDLMK